MAKITLGNTPKTFAPVVVTFPMPDGTEGTIEAVFKYRSRKQFGEFLRDTFKVDEKPGELDLAAIMAASVDQNGAYLADVLDAWNLDEKLTPDATAQLADELPAAAKALMQAYSAAVTEGRLGN